MKNIIKQLSRYSKEYPYVSMDIGGNLYLSKVSNFVLNTSPNQDFVDANIKIIASKTKQDGLSFITHQLDDLLWNNLTIFINGFDSDALYSILVLLSNMNKNEVVRDDVLSIFNDLK